MLESRDVPSGLNLSAFVSPNPVTLGNPANLYANVSSTSAMSSLSMTYNWGDGTSDTDPYTFNPAMTGYLPLHSHAYGTIGSYTITVTAGAGYSGGGSDSATETYAVTVTGTSPPLSPPPPPSVAAVQISTHSDASEDGTVGLFQLLRSGGDLTQPLTVGYTVTGSATPITDYDALSGTVTFAANSTSATISVTALADLLSEGNETVTATLSNGIGYTVVTPAGTQTLLIIDVAPSPHLVSTVSARFGALIPTTLIPVNANNDNGSEWLDASHPFIPSVRDFDATNLPHDDTELIPMTVTIGGGHAGILSITTDTFNSNQGIVKFWNDRRKQSEFQFQQVAAALDPVEIYLFVEGIHESTSLNDVHVLIQFIRPDNTRSPTSEEYLLTVTPVISNFTAATPNPSVNFLDQGPPITGLSGLEAWKPPAVVGGDNIPGIWFKADLTNGDLPIKFMQDVRSLQNGANAGGASAEFVGGVLANQNQLPKAGTGFTYPGLDSDDEGDPTNRGLSFSETHSPPSNITVRMDDSPATGVPLNLGDKLDLIDYKVSFRAYLVVRYGDRSIYPIATWDWNVNYYATTNVLNKGVSVIKPASKVSLEGDWIRSNADPLKTAGPIANGSVIWQ